MRERVVDLRILNGEVNNFSAKICTLANSFVTNCKNFPKNIKVFQKHAVIETVRRK